MYPNRSSVWSVPAALSLAVLAVVIFVQPVRAQIILDDFQSYAPDSDINGQGGWIVNNAMGTVIVDPLNAGNQVLSVVGGGPRVLRAIDPTISADTTATLFFRYMTSDFTDPAGLGQRSDISVGLSPTLTPAGFDDFRPMVRPISNNHVTPDLELGELTVRDGVAFPKVADFTADTWYNVWVVMEHVPAQVPLYSVYIQGGAFDTQTLLSSGTTTEFQYRTSPTAPEELVSIFIAGGNSHQGPFYVDDLWIDPTAMNLSSLDLESGDVNGDEVTDILDFNIIRDHFQQAASREDGDLTGNGFVDLADFRRWKNDAYAVPDPGFALGTAVPEPGSFALALLAVLTFSLSGNRARHSA